MVTDVRADREHPAGEQHPQLPVPVPARATGQPRQGLGPVPPPVGRSGRRGRRARRGPAGRARHRSAPGQEEPDSHPGNRGHHRDRDRHPGRESWDAPVAPASRPVPRPGPGPQARPASPSARPAPLARPVAVRRLAVPATRHPASRPRPPRLSASSLRFSTPDPSSTRPQVPRPSPRTRCSAPRRRLPTRRCVPTRRRVSSSPPCIHSPSCPMSVLLLRVFTVAVTVPAARLHASYRTGPDAGPRPRPADPARHSPCNPAATARRVDLPPCSFSPTSGANCAAECDRRSSSPSAWPSGSAWSSP